jgi:hypothetical protein
MKQQYTSNVTPDSLQELIIEIEKSKNISKLYENIVNLPFKNKLLSTAHDLGIVVYLQVNKITKTIDRIALSDTDLAKNAVKVSAKKFHDIKIPLAEKNNIICNAIKVKKPKITDDWTCLFNPVLSSEEARLNQTNAGIECSIVYPIKANGGGALIYSFYQPQNLITNEHMDFVERYSSLVNDGIEKFLKNNSK